MMGIDEAHFSCEANLYQLGLDSIMAIKLVSKLRQAMGVSIRVKDVFASKTVHALHLRLAQHQQQVMIEGKREQGVLVGELPLLPVNAGSLIAHSLIRVIGTRRFCWMCRRWTSNACAKRCTH